MRDTILKKFIVVYIVIILLGFFCVAIVSYRIDYNKMLNSTADSMYNQAVTISNSYASHSFSSNYDLSSLTMQLNTVAAYTDTVIMFVNYNDDIILDTHQKVASYDDVHIEDFDPTTTGNKKYLISDFHGIFNEEYLTVVAPISYNMAVRGYVVIHKSISSIHKQVNNVFNTNYITLAMSMVLAGIFVWLIYIDVHKPVKEITQAVKEYGHGNLKYQLKDYNDDEIGRLAAGLNYMSQQLNEIEESQKKFIANVSHDFRSPLTSIKGYLAAILDGTITYESQDKYLNIIIFETERLSKLTNNLLSLNNIDSKKNRLNIEPFDINTVIRHTVETFEGTCKDKGIKFDLTFSDISTIVDADVDKISQVLYNLIDNAIKFSKPNSTIYINVTERGEKAFVSVKDTGIGIPKDSVNKIWERFYKTDLSRGKDKKGTGLGLSIVKEIIKAHQENIDVISTEGVGTEFTFSLGKHVEQ